MSHHSHLMEALRQRGYRMTPQREMILEAIHAGHMTAEEIYEAVRAKSPAVNLATIYRTLDLLRELRILTAIDTGSGCAHFELAGEQPHHHLICEACGYTTEIDPCALEPLARELRKRYKFEINLDHLALRGTCTGCQEHAHGKEGG